MSAICRSTQICGTRLVKTWCRSSMHKMLRFSHNSREERPCLPHRGQVLCLHPTPCCNLIFKRQLQVSSKLDTNLLNEDVIVEQITRSSTADIVFNALNTIDVLSPRHIIAALGTLDKLLYAQLMVQPWAIHEDPALLIVQSHINSEAKEIYHPVLHCPEFDRLCYEAQSCRTTLSNAELVNVTLNLIRMNVSLHSDVFINLLHECQHRQEEFDLETMVHFADIANFIKRSGFILNAQIVQNLHNRWDHLEMSEQNFVSIIKLLYRLGYFMPKDTLFHYQDKILEMLKRYHESVSSEKLLDLLEALSRFSGCTKCEISEMAILQIMNRLEDVKSWDLPRVAFQLLHTPNSRRKDMMGMITKRATSMLTNSAKKLQPAEVVSLVRLSNLIQYSPHSTKILELLVEDQMKEFDVLLLKYVSIGNLMSTTTNGGLVQAFCDQVQLKMKDLFKSFSCLIGVTHCLSKIHARPVEFDRVYSHHLMQQVLEHQLGADPKNLATVGRYLIQCFREFDLRLVGHFTEKLVNVLPNLMLIEIANVCFGIISFGDITTRGSCEQIITNCAREVLLRKDEIENISLLNVLVRSVFVKLRNPFREAVVNDLEELYVTHAPSITPQTVLHTCHLLKQLRMRITVLCDHLAAAIITESNSTSGVSLSDIAQLLDLLIRVNYSSADLEVIQEIAAKKISEINFIQGSDLADVLLIAYSLSSFQRFPEDVIKRVFSLNFLMRLDNWVASNSTSASNKQHLYLYKKLSELNRAVMLQCPQLAENVAWFCDEMSKDSFYKLAKIHPYKCVCEMYERWYGSGWHLEDSVIDSYVITKWKDSVHIGLKDALGGGEYVKAGPLISPYNHVYDFECFLDEYGQPLPIKSDPELVRCRVAALLMTPTNYCTNTRTLSGHMENKVAQMEILGFKVVVLPYFHLDSMMLSDADSRKKYFYDMIVGQEN